MLFLEGWGWGTFIVQFMLVFTVFLTDVCIFIFYFFLQGPAEGSFSRHADETSAWQMKLPTAVPAMGHSV